VRDIALEIPLGAFALGRRRKGDGATDTRVQPLGDTFDHAALAGGVAALEQHDDLELSGDHPVLQPDQFALQSQQLGEVEFPVDSFVLWQVAVAMLGQAGQHFVAQFELEVLVDAVGQFPADAVLQRLAVPFALHAKPSIPQSGRESEGRI
jgi:hypothetical protein